MVLDEMDDKVDAAYNALPERLYLLDREGWIIFRTYPGMWNFDVGAWERAIKEEIERNDAYGMARNIHQPILKVFRGSPKSEPVRNCLIINAGFL